MANANAGRYFKGDKGQANSYKEKALSFPTLHLLCAMHFFSAQKNKTMVVAGMLKIGMELILKILGVGDRPYRPPAPSDWGESVHVSLYEREKRWERFFLGEFMY